MYREYFGLREAPFSIAPNPRYLYMSSGHQEALAHLLYGIRSDGGFVLLTGEVGTGKTTVCRALLEQMPEDTDVAFLLNPKLTVNELLATVCDELGIGFPAETATVKVFVDRLNEYLLNAHARGRRTVLIIEEAQNLGIDVLEQLRLLTNLETHEQKLLKIVLIGQPELRNTLALPQLRQFSQRITARYHLSPLAKREVDAYVTHRLAIAGGQRRLFPPSVITKLARLTGGVPRLINLLCDRALLGAYTQGKDRVGRSILQKAATEVFGTAGPRPRESRYVWLLSCSLIVFAVTVGAAYFARGHLSLRGTEDAPAIHEGREPERALPHLDTLWWFGERPVRNRLAEVNREQRHFAVFPGAVISETSEGKETATGRSAGNSSQAATTEVQDPTKMNNNGTAEPNEEKRGDN